MTTCPAERPSEEIICPCRANCQRWWRALHGPAAQQRLASLCTRRRRCP